MGSYIGCPNRTMNLSCRTVDFDNTVETVHRTKVSTYPNELEIMSYFCVIFSLKKIISLSFFPFFGHLWFFPVNFVFSFVFLQLQS